MPGIDFSPRGAASDSDHSPQYAATFNGKKASTHDEFSNLLELAVISRKGLGMVAAQDIKAGARIISEEAVLSFATATIRDSDKRLLQKLLQLLPSQHEQLAGLSDDKRTICHEAYAVIAAELKQHHQYSGRYLAAAARDFAKLHSVFYANAVRMGPPSHLEVGISPVLSRLNHSCTPNVHHSYNATIGREVVHAIKDIQTGEEIVAAYTPLKRPTSDRAEDLAKDWRFICNCDACSGPDHAKIENRRQRLYEIDQAFVFLEKAFDPKIYATACLHGMIPKTDGEVLRWAEEAVVLLRLEGLVGMDLAKAHRKCSEFSLRQGQLEKALGYARKELDVQITCLGTDTAYLPPDEDANVWVKHIESMSETEKLRMRLNEKRVQKEQKKVEKKAAKKAGKR